MEAAVAAQLPSLCVMFHQSVQVRNAGGAARGWGRELGVESGLKFMFRSGRGRGACGRAICGKGWVGGCRSAGVRFEGGNTSTMMVFHTDHDLSQSRHQHRPALIPPDLTTPYANTAPVTNQPGPPSPSSPSSPASCARAATQELTDRFKSEARRHYYVTPTSYLELLLSYKSLLGRRQSEVMTVKRRYEVRALRWGGGRRRDGAGVTGRGGTEGGEAGQNSSGGRGTGPGA